MRRASLASLLLASVTPAACSGSTHSQPDAGVCAPNVTPASGLVVTEDGAVEGTMSNGAWAFLGIPYAAPPLGALRWSAPQGYGCWASRGTFAATSFGPKCLQVDPSDTSSVIGSEDCLSINVWAPASATPASKLPVLFFVHGGGNVQGSSADTSQSGSYLYAGDRLAASTGAVVVTFNYRLGAMGFLAHPSFGANPGNYGLLDQAFALGWVSRNVAAFGGDPAHVLLFGQSAGAVDVCALVASPLAKGLFAAALMESGGCVAKAASDAQAFAQTFAQKVHCDAASDPAACMRALDANAVTVALPEPASVSSPKQGDYQPNVDGAFLLDTPENVILAGNHNHVPFVVGSNSNETSLELTEAYRTTGMSEAVYEAAVLVYAGNDRMLANQILALYPASDYQNFPLSAFIAVTTDSKFICTARYVARSFAKGQSQPVWRYFFTHHLDDGGPLTQALGAWHGLELAFVFHDLGASDYSPSTGEVALTEAMEGFWSSLAASGEPTASGTVAWPAYDPTTDAYLGLDDTIAAGAGVRTKYCDFWDQVLGR
jgi:para-nitrobenzyl esterase